MDSQIDSYLAKLNLEGSRGVWLGNRPKIDFILDKVKPYLKTGNKICEIGIGDGYLLDSLYDLKMDCTGIDISEYLVAYHKNRVLEQNRKIRFIQANIANFVSKSLLFDVVFCIDILEHLAEDGYMKALKNIYAMLKSDGIFVASFPYMENLDKNMTKCPKCGCEFHRIGHKQSFNLEKIKNTIMPYFKINEIGQVELNTFKKVSSRTPFYKRSYSMEKFVREILKGILCAFKRKGESLSYQEVKPNIKEETTCYFIAQRT